MSCRAWFMERDAHHSGNAGRCLLGWVNEEAPERISTFRQSKKKPRLPQRADGAINVLIGPVGPTIKGSLSFDLDLG
jgi:hypothetical protein